MPPTDALLFVRIRALGCIVKVFTINGTAELHAVALAGDDPPQVAKCNDGEGEDKVYRAACLVARKPAGTRTVPFTATQLAA